MKPITIYSALATLLAVGSAYWAWNGLPDLPKFPVHWNAEGVPDRYGAKSEVMIALFAMPVSILFTWLLFEFLPKLEPIRKNIGPNTRPYTMLWGISIALLVGIQYFIVQSYAGLADGNENTTVPIKAIIVGLSLFYLFIGNILSKVRQNFFVGIRTPWTLSSDLSWEKTHRLGARLMFASGAIGLISAFILEASHALYLLIGLITITVAITIVYSFFAWKSDPNKRKWSFK